MVDMHMDEKHDLSMADDVGQTVVFRKVISEYLRMGLVDNWDLTSDGDDIREVPSLCAFPVPSPSGLAIAVSLVNA